MLIVRHRMAFANDADFPNHLLSFQIVRVVFRGGECERGRPTENSDPVTERVHSPLGDYVLSQLSFTLLYSRPVPMVIFKRFQNIFFGLLGRNVLWQVWLQLLGMEANLYYGIH